MNDLTTPSQNALMNPSLNHGSVAIEQERAIAEVRGQIQIAKMFPRSLAAATSELMEACKSLEFAQQAFYSVPNRGSGPSIRFAEEVARCYENFQYGHRELSRSEGKSEIEVFAWDVQRNNYSKRQITVLHQVDTKNGPKILRDQADIDNRIANVASKQMRGRILALVPKAMVAAGMEACKRTLAGNNSEPMSARIQRMQEAFRPFGVNTKHLSDYLGHSLDDVTIDEIADLTGIYNAIKEGAKASEYFNLAPEVVEASASVVLTAAPPAAPVATRQRRPVETVKQAESTPQTNPVSTPAPQQPEPPQDQDEGPLF